MLSNGDEYKCLIYVKAMRGSTENFGIKTSPDIQNLSVWHKRPAGLKSNKSFVSCFWNLPNELTSRSLKQR